MGWTGFKWLRNAYYGIIQAKKSKMQITYQPHMLIPLLPELADRG